MAGVHTCATPITSDSGKPVVVFEPVALRPTRSGPFCILKDMSQVLPTHLDKRFTDDIMETSLVPAMNGVWHKTFLHLVPEGGNWPVHGGETSSLAGTCQRQGSEKEGIACSER